MKNFLIAILFTPVCLFAQDRYHVTLMRAAPGELSNLIQEVKKSVDSSNKDHSNKSYILRHSQGDQWDLMLIEPEGRSVTEDAGNTGYGSGFYDMVSWQEEALVEGPAFDEYEQYFSQNSFFHIEMFVALAGKQGELLKERQMENDYLEETERKPNLIFTRIMGFRYGIFTIGAYGSLLEYAEGGNKPLDMQEKAAIKSGFKSASDIGFYLRTLLSEHHDTLANKVK